MVKGTGADLFGDQGTSSIKLRFWTVPRSQMTLAFGGQWTSPSMWTRVWNQKHHNVHQVQSSNVHKLLTCFLEKSDVLKFVVDICGWLSTCSPSVGDLAILALVSTSVPETSSEWDHPARHISACLGARTGEGPSPETMRDTVVCIFFGECPP